jgi:cytoskeleton protein RodZ
MRGVSLDEIAAATKIGTRLLRALEDEQFDLLPGGIFNKGFIRAYAKYLGIDEEAVVADYLSTAGQADNHLRALASQDVASYPVNPNFPASAPSKRATFPFVPVLILIVVVVAASGAWRIYQDRLREQEAKHSSLQPAAPAMPPVASGTTDRGQTGSNELVSGTAQKPNSKATTLQPKVEGQSAGGRQDASTKSAVPNTETSSVKAKAADLPSRQVPAPSSGPASSGALIAAVTPVDSSSTPFEIIVKAKDRAWVSIKSDGKIMVRGIIKPPDIKTIRANDQVVFWTGNAGDVEVSFNGRDVPLSGGQNEERVLVFNSRGLLPQAPQ